jgi:hypothetical protein
MDNKAKALACLTIAVMCNAIGDMGKHFQLKSLESTIERLEEQILELRKRGE